MHQKKVVILLMVVFALFPAFSQQFDPKNEALLQDAADYAAYLDVDSNEAVRRLTLQKEIGMLDAHLAEVERDSFAGLWIEHEPRFLMVVRFTDPAAEDRTARDLIGSELAPLLRYAPAQWSLAQLEESRIVAHHLVRELGVQAETNINVMENRVEVRVVDVELLNSRLSESQSSFPSNVTIQGIQQFFQPEQLTGGGDINLCTSGFTVRRSSNNEMGISTAAHCPNNQTVPGYTLTFKGADQTGNQDVQWHAVACGQDVSNQFESGLGLRSCTGTQHRNNQAIGSAVFKYGATTHRTWGYIASKTYAPSWVSSAASTFIYVDGDRTMNLSEGGDSGGPWFVEGLAYGIHSGGGGNDSIYMPINYISSLGVSVLTYDPSPGACNPTACFNWTYLYGTRVDFDASCSFPAGAAIVSYTWDWGDGSQPYTSSSPTATYYYPSQDSYFVSLTVTDSQGNQSTDYDFVSLCEEIPSCEL